MAQRVGGNWLIDGGTSAAAPLVASAMAVISADLRRHHRPPLGPADGLLYYLRRHGPAALWDIVHGNNRFLGAIPGHAARRGYDLASGLGVPEFAEIARRLPAPGATRRPAGRVARRIPAPRHP
jgi:subtilase family serine protease